MSSYELVVVGTSLGGLNASLVLLASFPANFSLPVVLVQHRRRGSDDTLRSLLQEVCALPVTEARDKEFITPGTVYIAPSDYHLLVEPGYFALSTEAAINYSRPSIDVLFESAALAYRNRLIGVILTGSNRDGAEGLSKIKRRGGYIIVQDPASAFSPVMPQSALASIVADQVLAIEAIGPCLTLLSQT